MTDPADHHPWPRPPVGFAEGGASAHEPPGSMAAFELALRLGASGIASLVWLTSDNIPVLSPSSSFRRGLRRVRIADVADEALPSDLVRLDQLLAAVPTDIQLLLTVPDQRTAEVVFDRVRDRVGPTADRPGRVWLGHHDWRRLSSWRPALDGARLVDTTRLSSMPDGPERRAAQLAEAGVDSVRLPYEDWTGGLVVLFRRFDVGSVGAGAIHDRMFDDLLRMDVDAVVTPHVDRLIDALHRAGY